MSTFEERIAKAVTDKLNDEEFKKIVWDAIKNNKVKYHRGRRR